MPIRVRRPGVSVDEFWREAYAGIPPGFDLLSGDLDAYGEKGARLKSGRLEKFTVTPTQAILYFDSIAPAGKLSFTFQLRAKYPVRARTFQPPGS